MENFSHSSLSKFGQVEDCRRAGQVAERAKLFLRSAGDNFWHFISVGNPNDAKGFFLGQVEDFRIYTFEISREGLEDRHGQVSMRCHFLPNII